MVVPIHVDWAQAGIGDKWLDGLSDVDRWEKEALWGVDCP